MPARNGFLLGQLVVALDHGLLERYLRSRLPADSQPPSWVFLNGAALDLFLTDELLPEIADPIRDDLAKVNDVAEETTGVLANAFERNLIDRPARYSPESLALLLLIDHPDAWDYVWTRHLWIGSARRVTTYPIDEPDVDLTVDLVMALERSVQRWFEEHARGEQAQVLHFVDHDESLFLIRHGSYLRTVSIWDQDAIAVRTYRPAIEDVLIYDGSTKVLRIQASSLTDREEYLRLFARDILGDETAADRAASGAVYTLQPFQDETFNYGGAGVITRVNFVQAQMHVFGVAETTVIIKARDIREAFAEDLHPLTLKRGHLDWVRLRFDLRYPGERATSVTFTVIPPAHTNIRESRHAAVIFRYLEQQGVKLR